MSHARPTPAASLLVLRPAPSGEAPFQLYMLRRHPKNRFMANAQVFPGGKVDPDDRQTVRAGLARAPTPEQAAARLGADDGEQALAIYVAGVRETFEEAGLLLGLANGAAPGAEALQRMREQLNNGEATFGELLARAGLSLDLSGLRYTARWVTPTFEKIRFDAYFFVGIAPCGQRASHDVKEASAGAWCAPGEVLCQARRRELTLVPPTLCLLEDLAPRTTLEQALAAVPDRPTAAVEPVLLPDAPVSPTLLLPDDGRYPGTTAPADARHYVTLEQGVWRRHRSE